MKIKKSYIILISLIMCALSLFFIGAQPVMAEEVGDNEVVVIGVGQINFVPDTAIISCGVVTNAENIEECQKNNEEKLDSLIQALKDYGIDESDISTKNYTVTQRYDYSNQAQFVGYQATNYIDIKTTNLDKLGELVSLVMDNGAGAFYNIEFTVDDYNKVYNQALVLALENAKSKCAVLTGSDNLVIKNIKELEYCYMPQVRFQVNAEYSGMDIYRGTILVEASIQVTFEA